MKTNVKDVLIVTTIIGMTLFQFAQARAGVNVNEAGNSILCKGASCKWVQNACKEEGGKYTEGAGGTGKCNFPATSKIDDFATPTSSPTPTRQRK